MAVESANPAEAHPAQLEPDTAQLEIGNRTFDVSTTALVAGRVTIDPTAVGEVHDSVARIVEAGADLIELGAASEAEFEDQTFGAVLEAVASYEVPMLARRDDAWARRFAASGVATVAPSEVGAVESNLPVGAVHAKVAEEVRAGKRLVSVEADDVVAARRTVDTISLVLQARARTASSSSPGPSPAAPHPLTPPPPRPAADREHEGATRAADREHDDARRAADREHEGATRAADREHDGAGEV